MLNQRFSALRNSHCQAHYNNVDNAEGLVDSSGFNIRLSTKLRRYDMGLLFLVRLEF